jgi:hypothetical protein
VNGRDYALETAKAFAARVGCRAIVCGHSPTAKGHHLPNPYQLIIDSQHQHGCYLAFDLRRSYTALELQELAKPLVPEAQDVEVVSSDLM